MTAQTTAGQQVQHLDPSTLLVDVNVRTAASADEDLTESVRTLGVLQPIVAVRTSDGGVRVRYGHRRTLAALAASLPTVPVLVVADEATDDEAQVDRLVRQYAENEHRAGLTAAEKMGVASQLSAFGVSATQIAKRTRMPRAHVDAALTVASSPLAAGATERYDFLDLTQAAVLADFEDEPDTVTALVAAAKTGQFEHVAQRARDARALRRQGEEVAADLAARGVPVVERPGYDDQATSLADLKHGGAPLTDDSHAQCPGHAAYIRPVMQWVDPEPAEATDEPADGETSADVDQAGEDLADPAEDDEEVWYDEDGEAVWDTPAVAPGAASRRERVETMIATYVCLDPKAHGHAPRWGYATGATTKVRAADMSESEREEAKAARRDVIESNKAWKSAEAVRRDWLRGFLTRKTAPKGTAPFVASALALHADTVASSGGNTLAADLLGMDAPGYGRSPAIAEAIAKATDARAQVLALALVLAAYEDGTHQGSWRSVNDGTRRYLTFIQANGYTLSDVERRACGEDPLPVPPAAVDQGDEQAEQPTE